MNLDIGMTGVCLAGEPSSEPNCPGIVHRLSSIFAKEISHGESEQAVVNDIWMTADRRMMV